MLLTSGKLVLTDEQDQIILSEVPPKTPDTEVLWLDTSVTPNILKKWNGSSWLTVNDTTNLKQTVETLQTDFTVEQGKVSTLIKNTTIENKDGSESTLKDKYLETVQTIDGINTTVKDVQTDVNGLSAKVAEIKITTDGVSSTVTNNKTKWNQAVMDAHQALIDSSQAKQDAEVANESANNVNETVKQTVKSIDYEFALSNSKTEFDKFTEWNLIPPSFVEGKFMWQRTKTTYVDSIKYPTVTSTPVCISGNKGDKGLDGNNGDNGVSITKVDVLYKQTESSMTVPEPPTSTDLKGWITVSPTWVDGKYIWSCTETTLSDNTKTYSSPVCITGQKGNNGTDGLNGRGIYSVIEEFAVTKDKINPPSQLSNLWKQKADSWEIGKYIWTRSKITYRNPDGSIDCEHPDYTTPLCASEWEAIDNIQIGGKNIVLRSGEHYIDKDGGYLIHKYDLSENYDPNSEYVLTIRGNFINNDPKYSGCAVWRNGASNPITTNVPKVKSGVYQYIFKPEAYELNEPNLSIYNYPSSTAVSSEILSVKLEKGNKPTDWTPAPEDIDNAISKIDQKADRINLLVKSGTSESNLQLTSGAITAISNNINLKGKVSFETLNSDMQGKVNAPMDIFNAWKSSPVYGKDVTTINGGFIQANTVSVNQLNVDNILANNSIFAQKLDAREINANMITAGTVKATNLDLYGLTIKKKGIDQDIETLNISQDGDITLKGSIESYNYVNGKDGWSIKQDGSAEFNDVIVRGSLITKDSGLVNDAIAQKFTISDSNKKIRFWAGSSFENRDQAPFIVYNDGTFKASMGSYDGVCTGKIEIGNVRIEDPNADQGNDANIVVCNGNNGVKVVQLKDGTSSDFAQNLKITNSFYETQVSINQNESSYFKHGIHLNDKTYFKDDSIVLQGSKISNKTGSLSFESNSVQIGLTNKHADLLVNGSIEAKEDIKVKDAIYLGDNVIFKKVKNGLNIDII